MQEMVCFPFNGINHQKYCVLTVESSGALDLSRSNKLSRALYNGVDAVSLNGKDPGP
jgi:hypothetical protein